MNQLHYFETEDILHLLIMEGEEYNTIEISPNVTAEINANGELIGIEILNASHFLREMILDSVQEKLMILLESINNIESVSFGQHKARLK